jgi:hypothetical protein
MCDGSSNMRWRYRGTAVEVVVAAAAVVVAAAAAVVVVVAVDERENEVEEEVVIVAAAAVAVVMGEVVYTSCVVRQGSNVRHTTRDKVAKILAKLASNLLQPHARVTRRPGPATRTSEVAGVIITSHIAVSTTQTTVTRQRLTETIQIL